MVSYIMSYTSVLTTLLVMLTLLNMFCSVFLIHITFVISHLPQLFYNARAPSICIYDFPPWVRDMGAYCRFYFPVNRFTVQKITRYCIQSWDFTRPFLLPCVRWLLASLIIVTKKVGYTDKYIRSRLLTHESMDILSSKASFDLRQVNLSDHMSS